MTVSVDIPAASNYSDTLSRCFGGFVGRSPHDPQCLALTPVAVFAWISHRGAFRNEGWAWCSYVGLAVEGILRAALRKILISHSLVPLKVSTDNEVGQHRYNYLQPNCVPGQVLYSSSVLQNLQPRRKTKLANVRRHPNWYFEYLFVLLCKIILRCFSMQPT